MNNILVLPMILPVLVGVMLVFLRPYIRVQRILSVLTTIASAAVAAYCLQHIHLNGIMRLDFGDWLPPHGILFVGDSFAMLLVLVACVVSSIILLYAFATTGIETEVMFFYPFFLFLVAGVNGSFLTGDLFNLFVCFEVMLLASYVLLTLGGRKTQLKEGMTYVLINVLASWFFLLGIAYVYGVLGTLNMAHIAVRVAETGQGPLLTLIAIIFLIVFSLKAGLLLYFWLPGSYSAPPIAVAALFGALLTKVGIYALYRMFTLIFIHDPVIYKIIGVLAGVTMIAGCLGAIAYSDIRQIVSYNVIISVGFVLTGLAVATNTAFQGASYYLIHDMVSKALLFLLAGTVVYLTGRSKFNEISGLIRNYPLVGWLFFLTMLAISGIPPFSGFIGKVYIGLGVIETGSYVLLAVSFLSSIGVLYSLLRIFLNSFWGETIISEDDHKPFQKTIGLPLVLLAILVVGLGIGAELLSPYIEDAANALTNPEQYIRAVMGDNLE
ncbi:MULTISPECIES: Na+/H+ antiporter subunit D [unclassified Sporosarcina]|uniref:Na+/H+ antiporter subunit D n=1 Tax=unclassified Sporosarcina TaxID=2647733 RepID=UPI000C16A3A3|nr:MULTISPECIES: Na+/H+ antiporter subunit D [unclassified Sporosarcina]PID15914.1 Na+/H+ antiporter subunit D [Sporosarcina sp. P34]PID25981.1 Na+/H+ antiporter subunit D [Sporosarcina sp. P7]